MIRRRDFLRNTLLGGGALLASRCVPFATAFESATTGARIEVLPDEPLGTISPNIYGHFTENLSGVVYDGIWVAESSKIPNINGIRKELVEEMRKFKPSVVRFPGAALLIVTTGKTALGRPTSVPAAPTSGKTRNRLALPPAISMIPTSLAPTNSSASAS
jgi:alpha-L-arabinofuranosidase